MSVAALPDLKVLPADALRALILAQHTQLIVKDEQLQSREREIEHLQLLLAKLHRMQFGRKSEKLARKNPTRRNRLPSPPLPFLQQRNPRVARCRTIYRDKRAGMNRKKRCARNVRASCASWARTSRRCW